MAAGTSLIFRLVGVDAVTPATRSASASMGMASVAFAAAAAVIAEKSIKMAADWETAMTRVVTGAGETRAAIGSDSAALLKMLGPLGLSADALGTAFYNVNSAGYHAADALKVTEAAAKGAKVGAADLYSTTNALTTILNAYKMGANGATEAMNILIGTEVYGKATLEDLAKAFPTVATTAAVAGVSLEELGGAMATLTHFGVKADVAATYLRQTIMNLSAPTPKATRSMEALGLKATDVARAVGEKGLGSALNMLTAAIQRNMGPAGLVLMNTLKKASGSTTEFEKALENLRPKERTQIGALADMVGGVKSMQAALMLSGPYAAEFAQYTGEIGKRAKSASGEVEGWADVQETLNFKISALKGELQSLGIQLGNVLIPYVKKGVDHLYDFYLKLQDNSDLIKRMAGPVGYFFTTLIGVSAVRSVLVLARSISALGKAMLAFTLSNPYTAALYAIAGALVLLYTKTHILQDAWKRVWPEIHNAFLVSKKYIQAGLEFFTKDLPQIWDRMTSGARRGWASFTGAIKQTWDSFKFDPERLYQSIAHMVSYLATKARQMGNALAPMLAKIPGLIGGLGHLLQTGISRALGAIPGLMRRGSKLIENALFTNLGRAFRLGLTVIQHFPELAGGAFTKLGPIILKVVVGLPALLLVGLVKLGGWLASTLWIIIKGIGPILWQGLQIAFGFAVRAIGFGLGMCVKILMELPGFLWNVLKELGPLMVKGLELMFEGLAWIVTTGIPKALGWFGMLLVGIGDFFIHADWGKIGQNILDGLIHGLEALAGGIVKLANWLAEKLTKGFTDALGISSPSKVFAGYGKHMVDGLVGGIQAHSGRAATATEDLARLTAKAFERQAGAGGRISVNHSAASRNGGGNDLTLRGNREVVQFIRKLVKDYGGGDVKTAFGGAK